MYDPQALAEAETHLIHVLENSNPPRDITKFDITAAAQDFHETTGSWDVKGADQNVIEDVLTRHGK